MAMAAGRLRWRITIQSSTAAKGAEGQDVLTWAAFWSTWANIEPLTGTERQTSETERAQQGYTFTIRYRSAITPRMRISWDGRTFDIESVVNVENRKRTLVLTAVERDL
jgi:SPP1 family predicted phage head-tail adaptor